MIGDILQYVAALGPAGAVVFAILFIVERTDRKTAEERAVNDRETFKDALKDIASAISGIADGQADTRQTLAKAAEAITILAARARR